MFIIKKRSIEKLKLINHNFKWASIPNQDPDKYIITTAAYNQFQLD